MGENLQRDLGSFRDPSNAIFSNGSGADRTIYRALDAKTADCLRKLARQDYFLQLLEDGKVVGIKFLNRTNRVHRELTQLGWDSVVQHDTVPLISYPYEWSFSMLKDAALLQLELVEASMENGWTMKDASSYNIQWKDGKPIFIDLPSFVPWAKGEAWIGYEQFCSHFLRPLLIRSHLGINMERLLRSDLEGITSVEAIKYFRGFSRFKAGVLSHVFFPSIIEEHLLKKHGDNNLMPKSRQRDFSKAMIVGLVQSLARLIRGLNINDEHTKWSRYAKSNSYSEADFEEKKSFILKVCPDGSRGTLWDLGGNTGEFSRICREKFRHIICVDADSQAIEKLYVQEKRAENSNILPLTIGLNNLSPNQGWLGKERKSFAERSKPEYIFCLALIHHLRISSNIPLCDFFKWLSEFRAKIVIEFVDRNDEMVIKLLAGKKEKYLDYNKHRFIEELSHYFTIFDRKTLKDGKRELFALQPK